MDENPNRGSDSDEGGESQRHRGRFVRIALTLLMLLGVVAVLIALFLPARRHAGTAARRNLCTNHLKQIGLALHNYASVHGALPPAYTTDADGKPLHSWRTLILPYMDETRLYNSIDLTKPWDDPVNAAACKTFIDTYQCPSATSDDNRTTYLAVVAPNSCLRAAEPRSLSDITDGTSKTLMLIEVDAEHAVPWMSPFDADEETVLGIGPKSNLPHIDGVNAVFVDGSGHFFEADTSTAQRLAMISIAGDDNATAEGED